ncbi:right-handed parallel beta-helix repeat-containing protein [Methylorubrum populi]|uniref:Uncharacterized protein n=1 Tax=Methylorubrum populi TaxID=223967 RepID=A0A833J4T6_9HYPH|nr:right-handed parallel beta-helix repeat-containing protein [Methylorubrum populi]KAB7783662.1 hypothetical protein F8B43_3585 [Methylorubrum populi]
MPYARPYNRVYSFQNFQAGNPSRPLPADQVDAEFNEVKLSLDQTQSNLKKIQRSDGALANGVVTKDSLAPSMSIGFTFRGAWAVDTSYAEGDGVAYGTKFYRARLSMLSAADNRPDLSSAAWDPLVNLQDLVEVLQAADLLKPGNPLGDLLRSKFGPEDLALGSQLGDALNAKFDSGDLGPGNPLGDALADKLSAVAATPAITTAGAAGASTGRVVNIPYLLGLRNKTINPRRYATWAGAMDDMGDGFTLDIPAGIFEADNDSLRLALTNKTWAIRGEGQGVSQLRFQSGNGIEASQDSYFRRMSIQGLSLYTSAKRAGSAILIVRPQTAASHELGVTIRDVEMMGLDRNAHAWTTGIEVIHGWNTIIENCLFNGLDGPGIGNGTVAGNGVVLRGASTPTTISKLQVYLAENGIYAPPGSNNEGLIVSECQLVGVNQGVFLDDGANAPLVEMRGGHCAAYKFGLKNVNRNSTKVSGVTFYKRPESTSDWVGVQCESSPHSDIIGCGFFGFKGTAPGGKATGITVVNSIGTLAANNTFVECDVAHAPVNGPYFARNNRSRDVTTWNANPNAEGNVEAPLVY